MLKVGGEGALGIIMHDKFRPCSFDVNDGARPLRQGFLDFKTNGKFIRLIIARTGMALTVGALPPSLLVEWGHVPPLPPLPSSCS